MSLDTEKSKGAVPAKTSAAAQPHLYRIPCLPSPSGHEYNPISIQSTFIKETPLAQVKTAKKDKDRITIAFREAGHAVMAWDRGILVEPLALKSKRIKYRQNAWNDPLEALDQNWVKMNRPEKLIILLALVSLAGPAAVRRHNPTGRRDPVFKERIENADKLLGILYDSSGERLEHRRQMEAEADRMFNRADVWEKIDRLAWNLMENGSLSGEQAVKILEK
jgi:hypothetical protein